MYPFCINHYSETEYNLQHCISKIFVHQIIENYNKEDSRLLVTRCLREELDGVQWYIEGTFTIASSPSKQL